MSWTLWMALRPDPGISLDSTAGDKLLHAATFVCLTGWWGNVFRRGAARGAAALSLLAFGIVIEFGQWLTPSRDADVIDALADAVGVAVGLLLLQTSLGRVLGDVENRWLPAAG